MKINICNYLFKYQLIIQNQRKKLVIKIKKPDQNYDKVEKEQIVKIIEKEKQLITKISKINKTKANKRQVFVTNICL